MKDINLDIYKENRNFTGEEGCKLILWHWNLVPEKYYPCKGKELKDLTYKDIWNYSSTGELSYTFLWWQEALKYYHEKHN